MIGAGEHIWTTNGPKGGQILTIVYDPLNQDTVYLSVMQGGIYRSVNGGKSWKQVASEAALGIEPHHINPINQIAVDPVNNNILYAAGYNGVVKSVDCGLNWQKLETGVSGIFFDIIIHPMDVDTIFIATTEGIFKSTDAGNNWTAVNSGLTSLGISSLTICDANPNVLYAGCWELPVVFKTSNGGATWSTVFSGSTGEHTRTVVVDPTNANIVYTSEYECGGILKSTDGGATWTKTVVLDYINMDANVIVVDPINPGIVYFGRNVGQLFKSVDSGSNWTEKTNGFTSGGDIHALAVNSFDNDNILVGTMASIFRSADAGQSWSEGNSGLNYTHIAALAIDPVNSQVIFAGTMGGGVSISTDGGKTWHAANNGVNGHSIDAIAVDPVSTNIVYIGNTFGQIYKSTNSGASWTAVFNPEPGNKGAPHVIVIDPGNTNIVYAGMARDGQGQFSHIDPRGIFKSVDAGASWDESTTGLTNRDVRALIIDPTNTNTLYAGTVGSGVFKTVNGAASWSSSGSGLTNSDIRALALDAANTHIIYAGTNGGGVFKSIDGGATWTPINYGITKLSISSLAVDSSNGNKVFAGPDDSFNCFFASIDGGASWLEMNEGLLEYLVSINAIAISPANPDLIYIGTYGGGVCQRTIDPETIVPYPPKISLNRTEFFFGAAAGTTTPSQILLVENSGVTRLNWTLTINSDWLHCSHPGGTDAETVTVSVDSSGLEAGTYTGTITISAPGAVNSPRTVLVSLHVYEAGSTSGPFGQFSTPIDGSTVSSSIPVTGWVLDDIGVESIKIYRGDGGNRVYIGDAVFVEGARTDVEQTYPGYPVNYQAGWGYMMLTNFLPGGGNGTFKIHAIATDTEGHQVTLGTKTIYCDNADAVKPFGAIDTPTQGGIASGSSFRNHGWVLTPMPNSIPTDGSTINVFIDGVNLGHPTYNIYRSDVASLFPGYANSDGAHAYFDFDTTGYTNGVHSIYWTAEDTAGNKDGIGSRFFTIQNTGNAGSNSQTSKSGECTEKKFYHLSQIEHIPVNDSGSIKVKRGLNCNRLPKIVNINEKGIFNIKIKELERIEVEFSSESPRIEGYTIVGDQLRPLPIGSTLETKTGNFYWQPGPGFIGDYHFVFIKTVKDGKISKNNIIVRLDPKFLKSE
jgi:photosystem II stability/assembly factor-like uncharacterized protein